MLHLIFTIIFCLLITNVEMVKAEGLNFGDGLALILGFILATLGILACLGKYARRISSNY